MLSQPGPKCVYAQARTPAFCEFAKDPAPPGAAALLAALLEDLARWQWRVGSIQGTPRDHERRAEVRPQGRSPDSTYAQFLRCARRILMPVSLFAGAALGLLQLSADAGEGPFFVTYSHQMEEPGNLEVATKNAVGQPGAGDRFLGSALEFEYGVKGWWTTEVYLDGQATASDSAIFTGYRWENRFRLLLREHWINPVLYTEFENINGADKTLLEVVNHDGAADLTGRNAESRIEKKRELEAKLILGSYFRGWTIAENFIAEKNLAHEPFEFGYSLGLSRPLALEARPEECNFCAENVQAGVEIYGGLGTHDNFGFRGTSHYVAPTVAWTLSNGVMFTVSPGFGVTTPGMPFLLRFGVSYEFAQLGRTMRRLFASSGGRP